MADSLLLNAWNSCHVFIYSQILEQVTAVLWELWPVLLLYYDKLSRHKRWSSVDSEFEVQRYVSANDNDFYTGNKQKNRV